MEINKDTMVSVTAVLYNDEDIVVPFVRDVFESMSGSYAHFELVLIDNGSTDGTVEKVIQLLKEYRQVRLILLSRSYNEQIAYTAGLENSIGDFVVNMAPNTDPPSVVPEMVARATEGYDIVMGEPLTRAKRPFLYRMLHDLFYRISNLIGDDKVEPGWSNFFCLSRRVLNSIVQIKDRVRYLKLLQMELGYRRTSIKYEQVNRSGRQEDKKVLKDLFVGVELLLSSSDKLLRAGTVMSLVASGMNLLYIFYALLIKIFKSDVAPGWTSMSMVLSFMLMVGFFLFFILGEYILLIYKETKRGPLYHIEDEFTGTAMFAGLDDKNVTDGV